nr:MAG TPA: hypothetical protein [Caudoviricetes sp.]
MPAWLHGAVQDALTGHAASRPGASSGIRKPERLPSNHARAALTTARE